MWDRQNQFKWFEQKIITGDFIESPDIYADSQK